MSSKTLLDELELPLAQCIDVEDGQALVRHAVPALDGDFLQPTGRRAGRVAVTGVVAASGARDGLEALRGKLRRTEPVDFVADIATATHTTRVLVEALDVREVAGKPERFEYAFLLREYNARAEPEGPGYEQVQHETEDDGGAAADDLADDVSDGVGGLVVQVSLAGGAQDYAGVVVLVDGTNAAGERLSFSIDREENGEFRREGLPAGEYTVRVTAA